MGWGQWEVCLISLGRDGVVPAAGPVEPIENQCDIMQEACCRSLNLLTLVLGQVTQWTKFCLMPWHPANAAARWLLPISSKQFPLGTSLLGHWVFAALGACVHHLEWVV